MIPNLCTYKILLEHVGLQLAQYRIVSKQDI